MKVAACIVVACAVLAAPATSAGPRVPAFSHAIVIVFENKEASSIVGSRSAPTFNAYARRYASLTQYYGVAHPSLPNYLALVSGSTQGITSDCTDCIVDAASLADSLEAAGKSWKTYAEGLPSAGFTGGGSGRYAKKHDPFLYFSSIANNPARRARVVPLTQLSADLRAGTLPAFSLIVGDLCHSMHDCSVSVGDAWLRRIAPPLLKLPKTAVFVIFDEGQTNLNGGGHTAAMVLGTAVRRGVKNRALASHYSVLRTIEDSWGLPLLGHSRHVQPITSIWR